jgi:hypothetical protein
MKLYSLLNCENKGCTVNIWNCDLHTKLCTRTVVTFYCRRFLYSSNSFPYSVYSFPYSVYSFPYLINKCIQHQYYIVLHGYISLPENTYINLIHPFSIIVRKTDNVSIILPYILLLLFMMKNCINGLDEIAVEKK